MTELLDALDALTLPIKQKVTQDVMLTKVDGNGRPVLDDNDQPIRETKGQQTVTVQHKPLLDQLQEAVASTIGAGAGRTMKERHALNVLDSDALFQFAKIAAAINDWCATVRVRPTRDASRDLRAWYAKRLVTNPVSDEWHIEQLHGWANLIRGKLNPWQKWEIKDPCPKCHSATWLDQDENGKDVTLPRPLLIEYPVDRDDILAAAKATCRSCGFEWRGSSALRSLRWDTDQAEASADEMSSQAEELVI